MIRTAITISEYGEISLCQANSFQSCYRFIESKKRQRKHYGDRVVRTVILPVSMEEAERLMTADAIAWDMA
jgi:hypothetical protein